MPKLLVIPLLSAMYWRTIVIQINYEIHSFNIIWDDPSGIFPDSIKHNLLESIKFNILILLNKHIQIIYL
jgi:hypothetical protein